MYIQSQYSHARRVSAFSERLKRLGVASHSNLLFSPSMEGYHDYTFGCRAGPKIDLDNLFHELGHAAEFGEDRAGAGYFDFRGPMQLVENDGPLDLDHKTCQATQRECRTFAYQFHLMMLAGVRSFNFFDHASVMRFMPDFWYVPELKIAGRTESPDSWSNYDQVRIVWCENHIREWVDKIKPQDALGRLVAFLDLATGAGKSLFKTKHTNFNSVYNGLGKLVKKSESLTV